MEPTEAIRAIETALRLAVRETFGDGWMSAQGAPDVARLAERRDEEAKRRDGAVVSSDLLDYAEIYHLTGLVSRNWEIFKQVFADKARTLAYFGVVEDVRNNVAHSRDLVPFERDLISGIAGQLRNQVALFRSGKDQSAKYYPKIERVADAFGIDGLPDGYGFPTPPRIEIGTTLTFDGSAFNAKGRSVKWFTGVTTLTMNMTGSGLPSKVHEVAEGNNVTFDYSVTEADVGELFQVAVFIRTESAFCRYQGSPFGMAKYDDKRNFVYSVNPPE